MINISVILIKSLALLAIFMAFEPIKRILSFLLFPVAYALRCRLRSPVIVWLKYLYATDFYLLWFFLDDSIKMEFNKEYADKQKFYPNWIWNSNSDFLRAWHWAGIRNSCVNWNNLNAYALGVFKQELRHYGSARNFLKIRQYQSGIRPYIEFWLFGKWFQFGWLTMGRFEIDLFKNRV